MGNKKIFYGRCSTSRQDLSAELQLDEVQSKFGLMSETYFDRGVSGDAKISKRVELVAALDALDKGDTLYIYSFSRIARDSLTQLWAEKEIAEKGAGLVSVQEQDTCGDSPEKKMMRTILSAVNFYEKEVIRMRVASARKTMRKNNRFMGGSRPYGYKIVGKDLVEVADEQRVIASMMSWKEAGETTQAITDTLNSNGTPSATGISWHYKSVRKLLQRDARV